MVLVKMLFKNYIYFLLFTVLVLFPLMVDAGVSNTKHNLSVSNTIPGAVKAKSETQVCIFCHTPHNASPVYPLWNHIIPNGINYITYESETLKSYAPGNAPPIDGFSKMCLGCHDGTIAIGALSGNPGFVETIPTKLTLSNPGYLGTNLSGGHPISIVFDGALADTRNSDEDLLMQLNWPINDPYVKLYPTQDGYGVQCTSCHDPHGGRGKTVNGIAPPPFWQKDKYEDVCMVCHNIAAPDIGHKSSKLPGS
jgi:hypothetical protein